jgi:Cu-Zn family superoxide dismutase
MRALLLAILLGGCATMAPTPAGPVGATASAEVIAASGARIGTARFTDGPRGVLIRLELEPGALAPGWHGAHLHEAGDCTDFAAGFKAAGAHARHGAAPHGLLNPAGPEAGDLANIHAPASGPILAELYAPGVTLAPTALGERAPLRGHRGAALILHANADDHTSQPIGGAGARVACAAVRE